MKIYLIIESEEYEYSKVLCGKYDKASAEIFIEMCKYKIKKEKTISNLFNDEYQSISDAYKKEIPRPVLLSKPSFETFRRNPECSGNEIHKKWKSILIEWRKKVETPNLEKIREWDLNWYKHLENKRQEHYKFFSESLTDEEINKTSIYEEFSIEEIELD